MAFWQYITTPFSPKKFYEKFDIVLGEKSRLFRENNVEFFIKLVGRKGCRYILPTPLMQMDLQSLFKVCVFNI